jgi:ATP-dependent DNA helicase PIF1
VGQSGQRGCADGGSSAFEEPEPAESVSGLLVSRDHAVRTPAADQLRTAASRVQLPAAVAERLREASRWLGVEIVSESICLELDDIGSVLTPGVRICFTGTAQDSTGQIVERWEMEQLAESAGFSPVKSVTKTRCEVLVTAEAGTQSGKARKAVEYGKP